jgi:hypothetical protein
MSRPLLIKYEAGCAPELVWKFWKRKKVPGPGMVKPAGFVTHFVLRHKIRHRIRFLKFALLKMQFVSVRFEVIYGLC